MKNSKSFYCYLILLLVTLFALNVSESFGQTSKDITPKITITGPDHKYIDSATYCASVTGGETSFKYKWRVSGGTITNSDNSNCVKINWDKGNEMGIVRVCITDALDHKKTDSLLVRNQMPSFCAEDELMKMAKAKDPDFTNKINSVNKAIQDYITKHPRVLHPSACSSLGYIIPVVVHVISSTSDPLYIYQTTVVGTNQDAYVPYNQVESAINTLNNIYTSPGSKDVNAGNPNIHFCLAQVPIGTASWYVDLGGHTQYGVERYYGSSPTITNAAGTPDLTDASQYNILLATGQWTGSSYTGVLPAADYLNIYVVNYIGSECSGITGYSPTPLMGGVLDGVVIRADAFGDNTNVNFPGPYTLIPVPVAVGYPANCPFTDPSAILNEGHVLCHEVGHYLDVFHPFQPDIYPPYNSCSDPNTSACASCLGVAGWTSVYCQNHGDFCCDMNPTPYPLVTYTGGLPPANCCSNCGAVQTAAYMYYSTDPYSSFFSNDEIDRMQAYLAINRSNLFSITNLTNTGIIPNGCASTGLYSDFTIPSGALCINTTYTLTSVPAPTNTASSYLWDFGCTCATPSTSTAANPTVSYSTPGTYTVTLTVNGTCTSTQTISVSSCSLDINYHHNAQWFFGQYCNLDFSSGVPVPGTVAWNQTSPTIFAMEGAYSYADAHGNAVYYTDGINLWNPNSSSPSTPINSGPVFPTIGQASNSYLGHNQTSTSAYGLMGCPDPADPNPSNPSHFYLFCAPSSQDGSNPVWYTTIDLNTNTVAPYSILTSPTIISSEGLTIVPHCNGKDYWVIIYNTYSSSPDPHTFYVYLLSQLGLNTTPQKYSVYSYSDVEVSIKMSPDLKHLAMTGDGLYLFDFDASTGIISNEQDIYPQVPGPYYCHQFAGASFDNTSTYLYGLSNTYNVGAYANATFVSGNNTISQVLVSNPSVQTIVASGIGNYGYMQLGPDDNIYVTYAGGATYLGSIIGAATALPTFVPFAVNDQAIPSQVNDNLTSIPNLPDGIQLAAITPSINVTYNSCTEVTLNVPCMGGYSYSWDFGCTCASPTTSTAATPPPVSYSVPGTYTVTCTLSIPGNPNTIVLTQQVTVGSTIAINGPTPSPGYICAPSLGTYTYSAPYLGSGATYTWSTTAGTIVSYGPNNQSVQIAWGNASGTATITLTVVTPECTFTGTYTVIFDPGPTVMLNNTMNACGGNNGSATANVSGGYTPYTYSWSDGATTSIITGLSAGTYTVDVNDVNGCNSTASVTIISASPPTASISSSTNVSCYGGSNGSATASGSGGTSPYAYSWTTSPVQTNATATGLTAGTYTVTVTDANGCTATTSVNITQPSSGVSVSITGSTNVSCYGGSNGSATASGSGGTSPYAYSWTTSPVQTNVTATGLTAGTYTVTVTDANGCTATTSVNITQPSSGVSVSITGSTNVSCYGGSNGSATASGSGGTSPYAYSWTTSPVQTNATATGLTVGTYTVTVTDANGCTATTSVNITQPSSGVSASITGSTNVSCYGGSNGSATASGSGGTSPYTYSWSPSGGTSATASNLTAGTYTVTVTDALGCTATTSVTIAQPTALVATTTILSGQNCEGYPSGSASVSATGGTTNYTYSWSNGQTTTQVSSLSVGTYTVTVTDAHGCTATASATITQDASPTVTISPVTNVSCHGGNNGSATANASGGTPAYTYSWSNGETSSTATGLSAGTYTVTVRDVNGCPGTASVTITQPAASLTASIYNEFGPCGAAPGTLDAGGSGGTPAYTYSWSNGSSSNTNSTITGLSAGTYTLTVTDAHGCTSTASYTVGGSSLTVTTTVTNVACHGGSTGSATANPSGGVTPYTYSWAPGGNTNQTATGLSAGTYTVTVTDHNGCTATATAVVTQPAAALSASITSFTNVKCNGGNNGSATVTASGGTTGYTYSWTSGKGTNTTASNLIAGTYTVTVTDAHGCTATAVATITQPAVLNANITTTPVCNGVTTGNPGIATSTPSGGTSPYHFAWSTGATATGTSSSISGLTAGTYSVVVTDANGCATTASITFHTNNLAASATELKEACSSLAVGKASVSASGSSSYTYVWAPSGGTGTTATGLGAGTYTVTVTDNYGCIVTASVTIGTDNLSVSMSATPFCTGYYYGSATATASSGVTPYTYLWNTGATTSSILSPAGGTYTVTVTDANGCTATGSVTVLGIHCHSPQKPGGDKQDSSLMYKSVNVYPNPASSVVIVETQLEQGQVENICIYNSLGQRIRCVDITDNITRISISDLPTGLYYYRVLDTSGDLVQSDKLMIAR